MMWDSRLKRAISADQRRIKGQRNNESRKERKLIEGKKCDTNKLSIFKHKINL